MIDWAAVTVFLQVVLIDLTLAGDNAIFVGLAARNLPAAERRRVILIGTVVATLLRIALALVANRLLQVIGITLTGGLLLAWVAWKMFREFRGERRRDGGTQAPEASAPDASRQALFRIVMADVSMSADNVLAVAGTARAHPLILIFGLTLSVALMAAASHAVASLVRRMPLLVWLGLAVVAYVACRMIYDGTMEVGARLM